MKPEEHRYIEVSKRTLNATNFGAMAIIVSILVACSDDWTKFEIALGFHVVIFPLNLALNRLLHRVGPRVEVYRAMVNTASAVFVYGLIDWPLPVWLWLPFAALAYAGSRHTIVTLAIQCGGQILAALAYGVSWTYPATFAVLTIVCYRLARSRIETIRTMLAEVEAQRDDLGRAHEALKQEGEARERIELELRQAQRLEAVGRLAAGVAHEINTPMQFIGDSLEFVQEGLHELIEIAGLHDARASDLEFLKDRLPVAMALATEGVGRVSAIVRSMKQFVHPGQHSIGPVDLNVAIENTLTMSKHEYKLVADVETALGDLPRVECNGGEIGQVLLNIIINASHAVSDRSLARGLITVRSSVQHDHAIIEISDAGLGIPVAIQERMFDPFFTTKEVGRGSGQGLAISKAIVERHGGRLEYDTVVGQGTTFRICLPISRPPVAMLATVSAQRSSNLAA